MSRGYTRFYKDKSEVPTLKELGKDKAIVYEMPKNPLGYSNLRGLSFQAITKEIFSHSICFYEDAVESLKRELASEKIKNNILTQRLIHHNISEKLEPNEIQEYGSNLGVILKTNIDELMRERPQSITEEIRNRIQAEMALVDEDVKSSFEYNAIMLTQSIKRCEQAEEELMCAPRSLALKDKVASLDKIAKRKADLIKELKELYNAMGVSVKELTKDSKVETQPQKNGGAVGGFDLSSLMKR